MKPDTSSPLTWSITVTDQPDQPEISTLDKLAHIFSDLTIEVKGLRADVQAERTGRHITTLLAVVVVVVAVAAGAAFGVNFLHADTISCAQRAQGRVDTRAAILVAVDKGALELGASPERRKALSEAVSAAVAEKLPPPDC